MGILGSVAVRRAAGGGALPCDPLASGLLRIAGERAGNGFEPDPLRVSTIEGGGRKAGDVVRAGSTVGDFRRRGAGDAKFEAVVCAARGRAPPIGEHVRNHRDHSARDLQAAPVGGRGWREPYRCSYTGFAGVPPGPVWPASADRGSGRNLRGGPWSGPRLPSSGCADHGAVRGRSVPGSGRRPARRIEVLPGNYPRFVVGTGRRDAGPYGRPALPHRRPGTVAAWPGP